MWFTGYCQVHHGCNPLVYLVLDLTGLSDGAIIFVSDLAGGAKLQVRVSGGWENLH